MVKDLRHFVEFQTNTVSHKMWANCKSMRMRNPTAKKKEEDVILRFVKKRITYCFLQLIW